MKKITTSNSFEYQSLYSRALASLQAGILLSYLVKEADGEKVITRSTEEICEDTSLNETRQNSAIKKCLKRNVLSVEETNGQKTFTLDYDNIKGLSQAKEPTKRVLKGKKEAKKHPKARVTIEPEVAVEETV